MESNKDEDQLILDDYIVYLKYEKKLSKRTIEGYQYDLLQFRDFLHKRNRSFINCDFNDISNYLKEEYDKVVTSSLARKNTSIKMFYKYLVINKIIKDNPCEALDRPKLRKKLPNVLSVSDVEKLLDINLKTVFDYRNKAMLEFLERVVKKELYLLMIMLCII